MGFVGKGDQICGACQVFDIRYAVSFESEWPICDWRTARRCRIDWSEDYCGYVWRMGSAWRWCIFGQRSIQSGSECRLCCAMDCKVIGCIEFVLSLSCAIELCDWCGQAIECLC